MQNCGLRVYPRRIDDDLPKKGRLLHVTILATFALRTDTFRRNFRRLETHHVPGSIPNCEAPRGESHVESFTPSSTPSHYCIRLTPNSDGVAEFNNVIICAYSLNHPVEYTRCTYFGTGWLHSLSRICPPTWLKIRSKCTPIGRIIKRHLQGIYLPLRDTVVRGYSSGAPKG